jgi:hypothetical protein
MSKRTNEELLERHEAGLPVCKSDEARLVRLIAAVHANKQARKLEADLALTRTSSVSEGAGPGS